MRDDTGSQRQRAGFLAAAITGVALLAAACGSGSPAKESATYQQALTFTRCLRTHGEPNWPNPTSQGNFNVGQLDISSLSYLRSSADCALLRPAGIMIQESAAQRKASSKRYAKFAMCMHSRGDAAFPDPGAGKKVSRTHPGTDFTSPSFRSAIKKCGAVTYHGAWWIPGA